MDNDNKVKLTQKMLFNAEAETGATCPSCSDGQMFLEDNGSYICDTCHKVLTRGDFLE